jgi:glycosyltransferase involved in cell wall biosynthesis
VASVRDAAPVPVANATSRGLPAAINQGLKAARGEYLVLLNNDVVVTDGWLDQLIGLVNARKGIDVEREGHAETEALAGRRPRAPETQPGSVGAERLDRAQAVRPDCPRATDDGKFVGARPAGYPRLPGATALLDRHGPMGFIRTIALNLIDRRVMSS